MIRTTRAMMVSVFLFNRDEINHLGLESEQWVYMECKARDDLRSKGLPHKGGEVNVEFGYDLSKTKLTLMI